MYSADENSSFITNRKLRKHRDDLKTFIFRVISRKYRVISRKYRVITRKRSRNNAIINSVENGRNSCFPSEAIRGQTVHMEPDENCLKVFFDFILIQLKVIYKLINIIVILLLLLCISMYNF